MRLKTIKITKLQNVVKDFICSNNLIIRHNGATPRSSKTKRFGRKVQRSSQFSYFREIQVQRPVLKCRLLSGPDLFTKAKRVIALHVLSEVKTQNGCQKDRIPEGLDGKRIASGQQTGDKRIAEGQIFFLRKGYSKKRFYYFY